MTRDYKSSDRKGGAHRSGGSLLAGILIGLILGLVIALGVAWYVNKMPSPFSAARTPAAPKGEAAKAAPPRADEKAAKVEELKPKFDFYKILPGGEEPSADKQAKDAAKGSTAGARESFLLQAGAFQNAPEAENLKARLALLGIEANIETSTLPDKGVLHRVRIGPYTSVEELNRTRDTLKQNGVPTTLIKVPER